MAKNGGLSRLPNGIAKALADFDAVSAYTWLAIAIAGAAMLQPWPASGAGWYGPAIAGRGEVAERIGMPEITFHSLRHSHASQLISSGVDIMTISRRLGHAKPSVTLAIYAHMFSSDDRKAAAVINAALNC